MRTREMATTLRFAPVVKADRAEPKAKVQPYFLEDWVIPITAFGGCWHCGGTKFYRDSYGALRCSNCGAAQ